ncbi:MAG: hypothetical protein HZA53_15860 [Planctomycetes bacterium]|nr:hypothetical protein [Planctomycetota bacterium]
MTSPPSTVAELELRLAALAERARRARMRHSEGEYPPLDEVQPVLAALVAAYRVADEAERARMRSCLRGKIDAQMWLLWVAGEWARGHAERRGADDFENALSALSLEDNGFDARDTYLALGVIWHRAHRSGGHLVPAIERVAALSSTGESGFAAFLLGLEQSSFLREDVLPHLTAETLPYEAEE